MIAEAFAVLWTLIHAALLWLLFAAVTVTAVVLTVAAGVWWAWQTLRRGVKGPSWARGRRGARNYARSRARRPDGRTAPPMPHPGTQAARTAPHSPSRDSRDTDTPPRPPDGHTRMPAASHTNNRQDAA